MGEGRCQKFDFCHLPFAVNVMLTLCLQGAVCLSSVVLLCVCLLVCLFVCFYFP